LGEILRVLILGGAGFVGRALLKSFEISPIISQIVVVDRDLDRTNLLKDRFETACFDIADIHKLRKVFEKYSFSHVFHLAANSDIKSGADNSNFDFNDTFKTSVALAEVLNFFPIDTLFFSSSSAVYGELDGSLDSRVKSLKFPISNYGWAKLGAEMLLHNSAHSNKFRFVNMRFPNVVGGEPTHGLLYDIKAKLDFDAKNLQVLGDGSQDKPYIHVDELVGIIKRLVLESNSFQGDCNIGPTDTITVKRIIEIILEISKLSPSVEWGSEPFGWPGDVSRYSYNENLPIECKDLVVSSSENAIRKATQELWFP
jgi:UDP-glucose 4-epimerase